MKRITAALIIALCMITQTVSASVLGTQSGGWQTDMGGGAVYNNNSFVSDNGAKQTENYFEYTPNTEARPVVVNGESIYGMRTITSAAQYMQKHNLRPLVGINGDFFSTKTGIPMGYTIIDGRIWSKENGEQEAIGFREDGTAFIDRINISTTLEKNGNGINIQYINKWLQKGFSCVNLLDSNFAGDTKTDFNALYVICSKTDGNLSVNSKLLLSVDEIFIYDGAIKIPDGKYVFVMDVDGERESFDFLSNLAVGDKLTLENNVIGEFAHDWRDAKYAISTVGDRLIVNGEIKSELQAGTAPRTAVGIKSDGNIVFYTIDGRQKGYSNGVTLTTMAKRMQELGCVDAINLDGGGSTAIGGIFPGTDSFVISNRPSDGTERRCANYLFLQDLREKTDIVWHINWIENSTNNFMAGTTYKLQYDSVYDTGNYKMDGIKDITFTLENHGNANAVMTEDNIITFAGEGQVTVNVTGARYNKTFTFETYEKPQEVRIINESTGKEITELTVTENGMINYKLEAGAYVNGVRLEATPDMFLWGSTGSMVTVTPNGEVSIKDNGTGQAWVKVSIAGVTKEIPIKVVEQYTFSDTSKHWARETIEEMADLGIINGFEENGEKLFRPDSNITRIQFCAIVAKTLGLEGDITNTAFTDNDKIQEWAFPYVNAMVSHGYIEGKSDDGYTLYFDPENSITRAEAFTIISRILNKSTDFELDYSDRESIAQWAENGIIILSGLGIIEGYEDNTIRPNNTLTRAEAAVLVKKSEIEKALY